MSRGLASLRGYQKGGPIQEFIKRLSRYLRKGTGEEVTVPFKRDLRFAERDWWPSASDTLTGKEREDYYDIARAYGQVGQYEDFVENVGQGPLFESLHNYPGSYLEFLTRIYNTVEPTEGQEIFLDVSQRQGVAPDLSGGLEIVDLPVPLIEPVDLSGTAAKARYHKDMTGFPAHADESGEFAHSIEIQESPFINRKHGYSSLYTDPIEAKREIESVLAHEVYHAMSDEDHNYQGGSPQEAFAAATHALGRPRTPGGEWIGGVDALGNLDISFTPEALDDPDFRGWGSNTRQDFQGPLTSEVAMNKLLDLARINYRQGERQLGIGPLPGGIQHSPRAPSDPELVRQLEMLLQSPVYRDHPIQRYRSPIASNPSDTWGRKYGGGYARLPRGIERLTGGISDLGVILKSMGLGNG